MNSDGVKPVEQQAIVATGLTKWFGEGETKVSLTPSSRAPPTLHRFARPSS
jgi:preprotein translocase subunit Sec61beta